MFWRYQSVFYAMAYRNLLTMFPSDANRFNITDHWCNNIYTPEYAITSIIGDMKPVCVVLDTTETAIVNAVTSAADGDVTARRSAKSNAGPSMHPPTGRGFRLAGYFHHGTGHRYVGKTADGNENKTRNDILSMIICMCGYPPITVRFRTQSYVSKITAACRTHAVVSFDFYSL